MDLSKLNADLHAARLISYARARAGWPVPLAGAIYWALMAVLGMVMAKANWSLLAAVLSGVIFPMAVGLAALFRNSFMKEPVPDQGVVFMAMASMLMFWPIAIAAMWNYNELTPLILAIGMSLHWPVFGWAYGRPAPFVAHMIVRGLIAFFIWQYLPDGRFTVLPATVSIIYLVSVLVLYVDSGRVALRLAQQGMSVRT